MLTPPVQELCSLFLYLGYLVHNKCLVLFVLFELTIPINWIIYACIFFEDRYYVFSLVLRLGEWAVISVVRFNVL